MTLTVNGAADERRARMAQVRLYLCTDARTDRGGPREFARFLHAALSGGVDVVQLRDRSLDVVDELEYLALARAVTREHGALLAVNDRADLALAAGADVFHTGQRDLPVGFSRSMLGPEMILGRSSGGGAQGAAALADPDVDYFCVGPVWGTPTKPGRAAVGTGAVRAMADAAASAIALTSGAAAPAAGDTSGAQAEATTLHPAPWFAIGGIDLDTVADVVAAGARRIVVVRAITHAGDPEAAARALRRALEPIPVNG